MPDFFQPTPMSPSMRREWIEIPSCNHWNTAACCLPPCGGSGLKFLMMNEYVQEHKSPSMRREWIEMQSRLNYKGVGRSPSMRREWIEISMTPLQKHCSESLPPCGGSGLKYAVATKTASFCRLPPCGGSGLKCCIHLCRCAVSLVSLHAEGVD